MNITREQLKLYAVTDRSWLGSETLYEQVEKALKGGVTLVQLREKTLDEAAFEKEGQELLELCHHYNVPLIINDNVELAKKIHADGVHIGQSDMEIKNARELLGADKIIGVTAKTIEQAKAAEAAGADYLGSGAVFAALAQKKYLSNHISFQKNRIDNCRIKRYNILCKRENLKSDGTRFSARTIRNKEKEGNV